MENQFKEILKIHNALKQQIRETEIKSIKLGIIEVFRRIDEFDNYMVSSYGNVKNIKNRRILKPFINSGGYYNVTLCKNGKGKNLSVHRLIAIAFIDNPKKKLCVDHVDNNRLNNNVNNLRWVTNQENNQNRSISSKNTSGVKGVTFDKVHKKWKAFINIDGKYISVGYYTILEDAKQARQTKAKELFGTFINSCEN